MRIRLLRLGLVAVLGVLLGVAGYVVWLTRSNPAPRDAPNWTLLATLPIARGETAAAVAEGSLYVIGGMSGFGGDASADVSRYDASADTWEAAPALPAARHHAAAVGLDGAVYVSGGGPSPTDWTPQSTVWVLAPGADDWRELPPMPEGRLGHRMVAVDGTVYVVGGVAETGSVLAFDVVAGTWSARAEMPSPRNHLAAVVVDGEIWVIGGRSGGAILARVDIYRPGSDTWREGPSLPDPTSGAAEGVIGGVIYISGGEDPGPSGGVIDRHWWLDTTLGGDATWQPLSPPPLAVHGAHGAALDGHFVIVGGALRQGAFSAVSWTGAAQAYEPP